MEFTRKTIVEAFSELGDELHRRRKVADIAVFGGSAMILQFDVSFVTEDIDAVVSGDHGEVMRLVQEIARRRGWNSSWLNEAVSVYLSGEARDGVTRFGSFPGPEREGLRVYVAKPEYLLAMKLRALRLGSRDLEDATILARALGLTTVAELEAVVARNFPGHPLDPRRRLILDDLAETLRE